MDLLRAVFMIISFTARNLPILRAMARNRQKNVRKKGTVIITIFLPGTTTSSPACASGGVSLSNTTGVLQSPNYPSNYPHNTVCIWKITAPVGHVIKLHFNTFNLESSSSCTADYTEIRDGMDGTGKVLAKYCSSYNIYDVYSSGRYMWVKFRSDLSSSDKGFSGVYTTVLQNQGCPGSGSVNTATGILQTPGFPSNYPHNTRCIWKITAPVGQVIKLHFNTFNLESSSSCTADYTEIRDGLDGTGKELAKYCSSYNIYDVYSSGRYMWVKFRSDLSSSDKGFSGVYTTAVQNEVCPGSGNVNASTGILRTASYPLNYPQNTVCIWKITAPVGHVIKLHFNTFNLVSSSSCTADYTEIRDGLDGTGKELAKYCSSYYIYDVYSSGRYMWVKFRSDLSSSAKGFSGVYTTAVQNEVCPGSGNVNASTGILKTASYPLNYPQNTICIWKITAPVGHVIKLHFNTFNLVSSSSCTADYTEIRDGLDGTGKVLAKYCNSYYIYDVYSSGRYMWVKFRSDLSSSAKGFSGVYTTAVQNEVCPGSGNVNASTGILKTASYPLNYPQNTICIWKITAPVGHVIKLHFNTFNLVSSSSCTADYTEIRDGLDGTGKVLAKYCNSYYIYDVYSSGRYMWVKFRSDLSSSAKGFSGVYTTVLQNQGCPGSGIMNTSTGILQSANYPSKYPLNTHCEWKIVAPPKMKIKLSFDRVNIESCSTCSCDGLEIYDGQNSHALPRVRYCSSPSYGMFSSGRYMFVRFYSDLHNSYSGFRAQYVMVPENGGCPNSGELNSTHGTFSTPGYPRHKYPGNTKCTWKIRVPVNMTVRLEFEYFSVATCDGCSCDYVNIYDGEDDTSALMTKKCKSDNNLLFSSTNYMFVVFRSDLHSSSQGFIATYRAVPVNRGCPKSAVIRSTSGYLTSPDYPSKYPNNALCQWRIVAPPKHRFILSFADFELEDDSTRCRTEYVTIYNTDDNGVYKTTAMDKRCGTYHGRVISSSGRFIRVVFGTDRSVTKRGFNMTYRVYDIDTPDCPLYGQVTGSRGSLQSPNYPLSSPMFSSCKWLVTVANGYRIKLTIDMTTSTSYNTYLKVYNVDHHGEELFASYYYSVTRKVLYSKGSKMSVGFSSSFGKNTKFRATYIAEKAPQCPPVSRLSSMSGIITSPGYPSTYPPSFNCSWTIKSPGWRYEVRFDISTYVLYPTSCSYCYGSCDRLEFYNKRTGSLLRRFCGRGQDWFTADADADEVLVKFVAGIPLNPVNSAGFRLSYSFIPRTTVRTSYKTFQPTMPATWYPHTDGTRRCSRGTQRITGKSGSISYYFSSPSGYPSSMTCSWLITVSSHSTISLRFTFFDIEKCRGCSCDYVEVRDITNSSAPVIGKFCGNAIPPELSSSGRHLWIQFVSDSSQSKNGFIARYSEVKKSKKTTADSSSGGVSSATIAGSIIGVFIVLFIISSIVICVVYLSRRQRPPINTQNTSTPAIVANPGTVQLLPLCSNPAQPPSAAGRNDKGPGHVLLQSQEKTNIAFDPSS